MKIVRRSFGALENRAYFFESFSYFNFGAAIDGIAAYCNSGEINFRLEDKRGAFRVVEQKLFTISDTSNQSWEMTNIALGMTTFSHIPFRVTPEQRKKLNLIVMFKYSHVLRYRLQGEISRYNIGLIYDGIYKRSLGLKDRLIFNVLMRLNPSGPIAARIVGYKNKRIRLPQSKPQESEETA